VKQVRKNGAGIHISAGLSGYVAELTSAFLCAALGIVPTVRHADYLGSWLAVLRADNRAIFKAASQASKAADFLLAFVRESEPSLARAA
jgi:antirestriction protein ArdC